MRATLISLIILFAVLTACTQKEYKPIEKQCQEHNDCSSGVCNHYKANIGTCAANTCVTGTKTDNNNFFCNENKHWQQSKTTSEACNNDYECYKQTCFMIPTCSLTDIPKTVVSCTNHQCVSQVIKDTCEQQGLKRILRKDQFMHTNDGTCAESIAQMVLPTVCAPCGNDICDKETETQCNCPQDCANNGVLRFISDL
ncbi:hypothetical protein HY485_03695 [Candidatus Woesearchaeota archaeon]|nr:hypothetical protein [Candidatus Woesearchaeota archaeon]